MPRKQTISLSKIMDDGFDIPFVESKIELGVALQSLSPRERVAIRTRFFGAKLAPYDQVGKRLKINRNEASRVVNGALQKLRESIR